MTWLKSPCWACWGSGTLKILSSAFVRSPKSTSWTWCGSDFVTLDNKMTFRSSSHSLEKSQSVLATPAHHSPPSLPTSSICEKNKMLPTLAATDNWISVLQVTWGRGHVFP
jgi:hypothetical protein